MLERLKPIFSVRFVKFCFVGASGVVVNLGCLALFAELLGLQNNLAAALAIEISINTNFAVNELWTFRDRRAGAGSIRRRWLRFHLVSIVGAALQWLVFVAGNLVLANLLDQPLPGAEAAGFFERWVVAPVTNPPDVGRWIYVSQLTGIAVATLWNFFANFYWTWKRKDRGELGDGEAPKQGL